MQLKALCKNGQVVLQGTKPRKRLLTHKTLLCMKITAFILLAFCLQVSATSVAQNVTLSEKQAPLEKVINDIKQQTGFSFFYYQEWLSQANPVNINVKDMPIEKALSLCFSGQPIDYAIVNKTIVLKLKTQAAAPSPAVKEVIITGRVTDSVGTPLIGATISNKNTSKTTVTNDQGEFNITANIGDKIVISFIGFRPFDFNVDRDMPHLDIKLMPALNGLKEVVVNTGYQQLPQERATGSFAIVNNQLFNRKTSPDVLSRLEGVVPGLIVNRNVNTVNNPNGIDISIRGYSTLFANAQPLIVVDNFPYDGNINDINPNDVENVTVLKDAAAASIWGVRSGNGVIVITTKKGRRHQNVQIEANANVTVAEKPNLFYNPNFMSSSDFISVEKFLFSQGYYDAKLTDPTQPPVSPVVQLLADARAGTISATDATSQINAFSHMDVRNDLSKYFYQHAIQQQYAVNLKSGGENSDYYFSLGYDNGRDGLVGNINDRLTINSNLNFYPTKNLTISTGLNLILSDAHVNSPVGNINVGGQYNSNIYPYAQLADANGNALAIVKDYNYEWVTNPTAQAGLLNWQYKPLDDINDNDNHSQLTDNRLNFGLNYRIIPGLSADIKYQFEKQTNILDNYHSQDSYYARNLVNEFTNLNGSPEYPVPVGGILNHAEGDLVSNRVRAQANYTRNWSQGQNLTAILGTEISDAKNSSQNAGTLYGYIPGQSSQFVDPTAFYIIQPSGSGARIPYVQGTSRLTDRYVSYFSNASYTFLDKYIISASARIDKSNLFGVNTNQKSAPLYSTGISWDLSKEKFYNLNWLPYLKLRATYGYNGNINKDATAVVTGRQFNGSYYFGLPFEQITNPGNPDLRWEKTRMINFGADFASKNNFLSGSLEYYLKKGIDLFGNAPLAPSTGLSDIFGNTANTKGRGIDIDLNVKFIDHRAFKWTANFLYSYALDKVTKYEATPQNGYFLASADGSTITPQVGKPIFSIYSFRSGPLTHNTGDPQGYIGDQLSTDYATIIHNQSQSVDSLKFNGSARPTSFGSFRNTFSYKSFSLSANVIYKLGYYFRRSSVDYSALFASWQMNSDFNKRWQQPGDETKTIVPSMPNTANPDPNRDTFYGNSEALIDKGDHIRLQDITASYALDRPRATDPFKHVQVYFNINNVGILWRANHDRLDPDLYSGGYPLPRTYSLGVKTNF